MDYSDLLGYKSIYFSDAGFDVSKGFPKEEKLLDRPNLKKFKKCYGDNCRSLSEKEFILKIFIVNLLMPKQKILKLRV